MADLLEFSSDVRLEAEVSPQGNLEAAKVLSRPRLDVLMPRLDLADITTVKPITVCSFSVRSVWDYCYAYV